MTDHEHKQWEKEVSNEFEATMDGIRNEPAPAESLMRSLEAVEAIGMTKAAWRRGYLNMLMCMVIVYGVIGGLTMSVKALLHLNWYLSLGIAFAIIWIGLFLTFVLQRTVGVLMAGRLLQDCGPHPTKARFLVLAVVMLVAAIGTLVAAGDWLTYSIAGFLASFAVYWWVLSTGRLQIREHGVWQYWSLLRWEKIDSYHWEGTSDATLMLQAKTRFAFMGRGALPVAIEQKDAVDALMQDRV